VENIELTLVRPIFSPSDIAVPDGIIHYLLPFLRV